MCSAAAHQPGDYGEPTSTSSRKRRKSYFSGEDSLYEPAILPRAPLEPILGGVGLHGFPNDLPVKNLDILIISI